VADIVVDRSLRDRLQELAGGRREAWLVAAVVVTIVGSALALLGRGAGARIAPPAQEPVPAFPSAAPSPTAVLFVDVSGAVRAPGLYSLPAGARVADAISAAGGARPRADLSALNLAELLVDGTKIDVPVQGRIGSPAAAPPGAASPSSATVSLNSADQAALETIPGIGPVTATAILGYRQQIGSFESIDQLLDVDGIGPATLEAIRPYVSL
jgi:competence protein ComEA